HHPATATSHAIDSDPPTIHRNPPQHRLQPSYPPSQPRHASPPTLRLRLSEHRSHPRQPSTATLRTSIATSPRVDCGSANIDRNRNPDKHRPRLCEHRRRLQTEGAICEPRVAANCCKL